MAYGIKYMVTVATQANTQMILYMLEDGYSGSAIQYPATTFNLQYIPSSDDPFEVIYASQLTIGIDVTDNLDNLPDFVTLNDRKYLCKLYEDLTLKWVGWALTDNIQMPFTTGIKEISFNAVCGLGMLASISYPSNTSSTLLKYSILQTILNCLNTLEFDANLNLFTACSLYSSTMLDRTDGSEYEPFAQTYISYNSIQTRGIFKDCLTIIKEILFSFGCRIFQSNGKWNILQINQQANDTNYYTEYDASGNVYDSGTYNNKKQIPDNGLFIGNSQIKIFRKGYNSIVSNNTLEYNDNLLYNGDFIYKIPEVPGDPRYDIPDGWDTDFTTNGTNWAGMTNIYTGQYNTVALVGGPGVSSLSYKGSIFINEYEEINLTLIPYSALPLTIDNVNFQLRVLITGDAGTFFYNNTGTEDWQPYVPPSASYYNATAIPTNQQWNLKFKPAPIKGQITIAFWLTAGMTDIIGLTNINISINNQIRNVNITAQTSAENSYRKEIQLPFGVAPKVNGKYSFNGFLSDVDGNMLLDWYMMERPTDKYYSLAELTVKNYVNQFFKNIINIDSTIETQNFDANNSYQFSDTDPTQISTEGKNYIIGSNTYQYNLQELQGTQLEISNTNQTAVLVVQEDVYSQSGVPFAYKRKISPPVDTQTEACALPPYVTTIYFKYITQLVGEYAYTDSRFETPFNGNAKYYGIFYEEQFKSKFIRIDVDGRIMAIGNC